MFMTLDVIEQRMVNVWLHSTGDRAARRSQGGCRGRLFGSLSLLHFGHRPSSADRLVIAMFSASNELEVESQIAIERQYGNAIVATRQKWTIECVPCLVHRGDAV